jgi:uncharacterized protein YidB (DUF937 family)
MAIFDTIKSVLSGEASTDQLLGELQGIVGDIDLNQLKEKFDTAGLSDKINSWISTGENIEISADEVKSVMDPSKLQALADDAGVDVDTAATNVAESLPQLVDKLTPEGMIPGA